MLKTLYDHYQSRYHDNPTSGRGASSEELVGIDELWLHLVDRLPMPDEVKYRMKFFADLCDENSRMHWRNYYWLTERNQALKPKLPGIEGRYEEVLAHLYPESQGKQPQS